MEQVDVERLLERCGALLRGHFLLTSGRHGDRFVQCSQVMQYPEYAEMLGAELARRIQAHGDVRADVVVGPAMGGIILAHETARALGARAIFTEKTSEGMKFRRGFKIEPGERVVVVEDVVTTGGSVSRAAKAVEESGGQVVAMGAIVDRSGGEWLRSVHQGIPRYALLVTAMDSYAPEDCPLCKAQIELSLPKD